jgi:hypothetical protein
MCTALLAFLMGLLEIMATQWPFRWKHIEVSGLFHASAALSRDRTADSHFIGEYLGPRDGLDVVE